MFGQPSYSGLIGAGNLDNALGSGNLLMVGYIQQRSQGGDRRFQQRRSHADNHRGSDRNHLSPRRKTGERRQTVGRRAPD